MLAILDQIDKSAMFFHRPLHHKQIKDPAEQAKYFRNATLVALRTICRLIETLALHSCATRQCDATSNLRHPMAAAR